MLIGAAIASAQSGTATSASALYTVDVNGHVVRDAAYVARNGDKTQLKQSVNGQAVPLESSEVHILTDTPSHRVTETIVRRYDPTGRSAGTERTVTDEAIAATGSTLRAATYRSDVNGAMVEAERRVVESHVQGANTNAQVTISRPGFNGSFEPAEKRNVVTVTAGDSIRSTEEIERPSGNGNQFVAASRVVTEEKKTADKITSSTALYELDSLGRMALSRQDVSTTTKAGNGREVTELNTYAPSIYGVARDQDPTPKLREQQTIVREEKNGVVTATTQLRRPSLQDPNRLSDASVISTLECTGACKDSLKSPAAAPAKP